MKHTRKILVALILVLTMMVGMTAIVASAAGEVVNSEGSENSVHILESKDLEEKKYDADNTRVTVADYFTLIFKKDSKVETKSKVTFEDNYEGERRLSFGGKISWSGGEVTKSAIEITTKGPASVKIWWVCGDSDNDRYMAIAKLDKTVVAETAKGLKGTPYIDTLQIPEAGTYYIGAMGNANYIYKIEVTEGVVTPPSTPAPDPETCEHTYDAGKCTLCGAADPNYVPPKPAMPTDSPLVMDFGQFETYSGAFAVGEEIKYSDYFTFIHNSSSKVESKKVEFSDGFTSTNRFTFGGSMSTGKAPTKSAVKITAPGAGTVKLWWMNETAGRLPALLDSTGTQIGFAAEAGESKVAYITEFAIPAEGTYYLGNLANLYWFKVELILAPTCEHDWVDATCTTPKTCSLCEEIEGEALGHTEKTVDAVAPTCTATGLTAGKICSVCEVVLEKQESVPVVPHGYGDWYVSKAPTETEAGEERRDCANCDAFETSPLAALSHSHDRYEVIIIEGKDPTCTETGLTDGEKCSGCGEIIKEQETIRATGHSEKIVDAVAPTCTATGLTEGKKCSVCEETLVAQTEVDATGHIEAVIEAVKPGCFVDGLTEGKKCSVCDEILKAPEADKAIGHILAAGKCTNCDFVDPNYVEDERILFFNAAITSTGTNGFYTFTTETKLNVNATINGVTYNQGMKLNSSGKITFTADVNGIVTVYLSHANGSGSNTIYVRTVDENGNKLTEEVIIVTNQVSDENNNYSSFSFEVTKGANYVVVRKSTESTAFLISYVEKLCEHKYTYPCDAHCSVCFELTNPDAAHTVVHVDAVAPTCAAVGNIEYWYCSDCGTAWADEAKTQQTNMMSVKLPAEEHTEETLAAVDATCTATGLTEGKKCSVCNEVLVAQETVAAKGHTYADGVCSVCGAEDPDYVPPHTHNFVEGKCECGESDPDYVAPEQPDEEQPEPELNFFQKIWKAITDFFQKVGNAFTNFFGKIGNFFTNLFGGKK